jgi:predicted HTH domain antitoxin
MTLTMPVSKAAEQSFREAWGDQLDEKAFEALVIQGYREKRFSAGRVAELVGLHTTIQAEQWLADRHVERNCDPEDIQSDVSILPLVRNQPPR